MIISFDLVKKLDFDPDPESAPEIPVKSDPDPEFPSKSDPDPEIIFCGYGTLFTCCVKSKRIHL